MLEILYQDQWLVAVNKPAGWLVHRSWLDRDEKVVVMQTVRDQIGQHVFTAHRLDRPTSGVLLMGLSSEAGRRLAQQFEQHHIRKRYHAIVRGWLMDDAVLDYPLVEERDKIADKFAREDKAPQPAVTQYRGLATVEMAVPTGRYPTTRYGLVELEPKNGTQAPASSSSGASASSYHRRQQAWRFATKPQRRRAFCLSSPDASCQSA